jgi:hypothetical protein
MYVPLIKKLKFSFKKGILFLFLFLSPVLTFEKRNQLTRNEMAEVESSNLITLTGIPVHVD